MKILVVQLLRMGDIIMSVPALTALQESYPESSIDLLINEECRPVAEMIPGLARLHLFPRQELQEGIGNPGRSLLEPIQRMERLTSELRNENYDVVFNFTHTRLSGYLCGLLRKNSKVIGLSATGAQQFQLGHPWAEFLNESDAYEPSVNFHYSDILARFVHGKTRTFIPALKNPEAGSSAAPIRRARQVICQVTTSDEKKEWGDEKWIQFARALLSIEPEVQLHFVGAEFERDRLQGLVEAFKDFPQVDLRICGLNELNSYLRRAALVVSGDTLTKHLAAAAGARVLEISVGSGDCYFSGPYAAGAFIIKSGASCYPCDHHSACFQSKHICSDSIRPRDVALIAHCLIAGDETEVRAVVESMNTGARLLKSLYLPTGSWAALGFERYPAEKDLGEAFFRVLMEFLLNGTSLHSKKLQKTGAKFAEAMSDFYPEFPSSNWRHFWSECRNQFEILQREVKPYLGYFHEIKQGETFEQELLKKKSCLRKVIMRGRTRFFILPLLEELQKGVSYELGGRSQQARKLQQVLFDIQRLFDLAQPVWMGLLESLGEDHGKAYY